MRKALLLAVIAATAVPCHGIQDAVNAEPRSEEMRGSFPIVHSWSVVMDPFCLGAGFDGTYVWVSAGDMLTGECSFYIFDEVGTLIDTRPQGAGATGWGHRDLCFDGTYMFGSYSTRINGFDLDSVYQGHFNGPLDPCRGLACDGTFFYTTAFGDNIWRGIWDGVWGSTPAWEALPWGSAGVPYGLAYDEIQDSLWLTTADGSGDLWKLPLGGGPPEVYTTLPEYATSGGCCMADTQTYGYVLAVLQQSDPDEVVYYDVGSASSVTAPTALTWGVIRAMFRETESR